MRNIINVIGYGIIGAAVVGGTAVAITAGITYATAPKLVSCDSASAGGAVDYFAEVCAER